MACRCGLVKDVARGDSHSKKRPIPSMCCYRVFLAASLAGTEFESACNAYPAANVRSDVGRREEEDAVSSGVGSTHVVRGDVQKVLLSPVARTSILRKKQQIIQ